MIGEVSEVLGTDDNIIVTRDKLKVLYLHIEAEDISSVSPTSTSVSIRTTSSSCHER